MYARGLQVAWSRSSLPFASCRRSITEMPKRLHAQRGNDQVALVGERSDPSSKRFKSTAPQATSKKGSSKVQEASLVKEKPAFRWRSKVETRCYSSTATEGDVTVKSGTEGEDGSAEDDVDLKKTLKGLKVRTVDSEMDDSMDYLSLETRGRRYQHDRGNKAQNVTWGRSRSAKFNFRGSESGKSFGRQFGNWKRSRQVEEDDLLDEEEAELERVTVVSDTGSVEESDAELGQLENFRISEHTKTLLKAKGIQHMFPIQYKTYDYIYDGKDVIGQARTGTGKTLSFVIPLVEKLNIEVEGGSSKQKRGRPPTVLVLAPTRELALQVSREFDAYSRNLTSFCIYGGASYGPQEDVLRSGLDILTGTPGRVLDHVERGNLDLSQVKHVVLDEADHMLERGFADQMDQILKECYSSSSKPQTLLFSATVPLWVQRTARKYMDKDHVLVDLIRGQKMRTAVTVQHKAIRCSYHERASTLADVVQMYSGQHGRSIIFTSTKREANELALNSVLKQDCQVLHGDISQQQREATLQGFRKGRFRCLVATDVAARGLDIPEVDLVVQTEPPADLDAYIHRSGRTGRAGRPGVSIMFYKSSQEAELRDVERRAGIKLTRIGAPQQSDIIKAAANDVSKSLEKVPPSVISLFAENAAKLIEEKGPEEALAAALALIAGVTEVKTRSLLSSTPGYTTYLMTCAFEIRGTGFVWRMLENSLPPNVKDAVKGMRLCKDSMGAVFDVPNKLKGLIEDHWKDSNRVTLSIPDVLPELKEWVNRSRYPY